MLIPFDQLPFYPDFVSSWTPEQRIELVRFYRNNLLLHSDWTQLPDSPDPRKTEWATYRQQLRDLMATYDGTSPDITWPTPPSTTTGQ